MNIEDVARGAARLQRLVSTPGVERGLQAGVGRVLRGTDADFDDAVQDGWVALMRQTSVRAPVSLAFHAGRSAAMEVLRRRKREDMTVPLDTVAGRIHTPPSKCTPFLRDRVSRAVDDLAPGQRRIFVRTAILGVPLAVVAEESGLHPGSARSQAFKARRTLRRILADLSPSMCEIDKSEKMAV